MRPIVKAKEPSCLTELRQQPEADYGQLRDPCKQNVRDALCEEQGFLCCYCMQRIDSASEAMKVEHLVPQASRRDLTLAWRNLFGACLGNESSAPKDQHCDTRKGDALLSFDLTDSQLAKKLKFLADGSLHSALPELQRDIDDTLNLNRPVLTNNRKACLEGFREAMARNREGAWSPKFLQRKLEEVQAPKAGRVTEYVQVLVYWLEKQLARSRPCA